MGREEWWQLKILKFSEFPQEAAVSVTSNSFGKFGPPEQKWKVQGYFADVKRVIYFLSLGCMQKYDIKHLQFLLSITLSFMFSASIKKVFFSIKKLSNMLSHSLFSGFFVVWVKVVKYIYFSFYFKIWEPFILQPAVGNSNIAHNQQFGFDDWILTRSGTLLPLCSTHSYLCIRGPFTR